MNARLGKKVNAHMDRDTNLCNARQASVYVRMHTYASLHIQIPVWTDQRMHAWIDGRMHAWVGRRKLAWTDRRMHARLAIRMHAWTDRRVHAWTDRPMHT